ncbi:hypothetical protein JCM3775_004772 [Rhodotorula graminis]
MGGELPRSGHSYFGTVSSAQEAHAILEACKHGLLPRVTRRLTDDERLRFVRAGAVFVWEEEEAGIRRWTDHIKWSPSRVSGAFLTYTEVPPRGDDTLVKQSFSSVDSSGTKMHLIAYTSKSTAVTSVLPCAAQDPLIQHMLAQRTSAGRDPRDRPFPPSAIAAPPPSRPPDPSHALPTPPYGSAPPTADPNRMHLQRSSMSFQSPGTRPQTASSSDESRPQTSASEPRQGAAKDPHMRHAPGLSLSYPSLLHPAVTSVAPTTSPLPLTPTFPPPPPSAHGSPRLWPFAYDLPRQDYPPRSASHPRSAAHRPSPRLSHSPPSVTASSWGAPSTADSSSATTASPFDTQPRHLPPLELRSPGHLATGSDLSSHHDAHGQRRALSDGDQWFPPRQHGRGAEDERQLRLLGRSF